MPYLCPPPPRPSLAHLCTCFLALPNAANALQMEGDVLIVDSELDKLACNEAGLQAVLALPRREPSWRQPEAGGSDAMRDA